MASERAQANMDVLVEAVDRRVGLTAGLCALAIVLRVAVGLHSYSGRGDPPKFGDYEAQRHWMEITLNLPIADWYVSTKDNDLQYWGIDYPPLSAYQSWFHGLLLLAIEPEAVALGDSRGYETETSKILMRLTALTSDVLLMFPAAIFALKVIYPRADRSARLWALTLVLLHPGLVLIDHGHFQYNCISLALTAAAVGFVWIDRWYVGSFFYVLALNHKHMSLYFALAFFAHLLGEAMRRPTLSKKVTTLASLAAAVILTFVLAWLPFLRPVGLALRVLQRLVPIRRGVFEDYVANFWCVTHVLVKWKALFEVESLAKVCALCTLAACAPSVAHQILRTSKKGFLICMLNCSLAFYLFSYQVHEKSILLPCLPAALLVLEYPLPSVCFAFISAFSMFPLLVKDGLVLAYAASLAIFCAFAFLKAEILGPRWLRLGFHASTIVSACLCALKVGIAPPQRYPYLFDLFISAFAFAHFSGFFLFWNIELWKQPGAHQRQRKRE